MEYIDKIIQQYGKIISQKPLESKVVRLYQYFAQHYSDKKQLFLHGMVEKIIKEGPSSRAEIVDYYAHLMSYYSKNNLSILTRIMLFDCYDVLLEERVHAVSDGAKYKLNSHFRNIVDYYLNLKKQAGTDYSDRRISMMSQFFLFLMKQRGRNKISDVTEEDVVEFAREKGWMNRSYRKMANQIDLCESMLKDGACTRVASYFPKIAGPEKEFHALTEEEIQKLEEGIHSPGVLSPLERAFGLVMWYAAPRGYDVKWLKISDIDWEKDVIQIFQHKTKRWVTVPLIPVVGNAILDYLRVRPHSDLPSLFVKPSRNGKTTMLINPYNVMKGIFEKCGVDVNRGRLGTHLLRHVFATRALESGTNRSTIAELLGHSHPSAVDPYISMDSQKRAACAIDISLFTFNSKCYKNGKKENDFGDENAVS